MRLVLGIMLSLLLVLVTGCGQREQSAMTSDADLQKRLLGTWLTEDVEEGEHSKNVVVCRLNGTWAAELTRSDKTISSAAGTFLVRGGVLITTTTNLTTKDKHNAQVSQVRRLPIVRIDDRELVLRDEELPDWQPVTLRRQR